MAFTTLYSETKKGCIVITGNTLGLSRRSGTSLPGTNDAINQFITSNTTLTPPTGWESYKNIVNRENITSDWRLNSSSAYLNMLSGFNVLYAELIWGGLSISNSTSGNQPVNVSQFIRNSITFTMPIGAVTIGPDAVITTQHPTGGTFYVAHADVTPQVQTGGVGYYTVGGVPSAININESNTLGHAGWTLIVAYENSALPPRNMSIYVGAELVDTNSPGQINISGFVAPDVGTVTSRILVSAQEGDASIRGDQLRFGLDSNSAQVLSGNNNPSTNFFSSQINNGDPNDANVGNIDTRGTFGSRNANASTATNITAGRQGWDVTNIGRNDIITNGQSQANLYLSSTQDVYVVNTVGIQIDAVLISGQKTVDKATANIGEVLTYTVVLKNEGGTTVNNILFKDTTPTGTTYVPGSLIVNGTSVTGNPDNGVTIASLIPGAIATIIWKVSINNNVPTNQNQVINVGTISVNNTEIATTNQVVTNIIYADVEVEKSKVIPSGATVPGENIVYKINAINNGPYQAKNVVINDVVPTSIITPEFSLNSSGPWSPWIGYYAIGDLVSSVSIPIYIRGLLNPAMAGSSIINTVKISSVTLDKNTLNNEASASSLINPRYGVTVDKKGVPNPVTAGNSIDYTVAVSNSGPSVSPTLIFNDVVPSAIENVEYSLNGGISWTGATNNLINTSIGILHPLDVYNILIRGQVKPSAKSSSTIINNGIVTGGGNTFTGVTSTFVNVSADMAVIKTIASTTMNPSSIIYKIETRNFGPSNASSVILKDSLPSGISAFSYSVDSMISWMVWPSTSMISFSNAFVPGGITTIYLRGLLDDVLNRPDPIINTVKVSSITPDPNLNNNESVAQIDQSMTSLSIIKDGPATINAGEIINYTITIENETSNSAEDVIISDDIPVEIINHQWSIDGITWINSGHTFSVGTIPGGETVEVYIRGTVQANVPNNTTITNKAIVTSTTTNGPVEDGIDTVVSTSADISVVKEIVTPSDEIKAGGFIYYKLTINNIGPSISRNITINDYTDPLTVVDSTEISTETGVTWVSIGSGLVIGDLAPNTTVIYFVRQKINSLVTDSFNNIAEVNSSETLDPNTNNNTSEIPVKVNALADLVVTKQLYNNVTEVIAGEGVIYEITIRNDGPSAAAAVKLIGTLTPTINNIEYATDPINGPWNNWQGSYSNGILDVNQIMKIYIRGDVPASAIGTLVNAAEVSSTTPENNPLDNSVEYSTNILRRADISVVKEIITSEVVAGQKITYSKIITNNGPSDTTNVVLIDILPTNIENQKVKIKENGGWSTWSDWTGTYTIPTLTVGESVEIIIEGDINSNTIVDLKNTASIDGDDIDLFPDNNTDTVETPVNARADLSILKTATPNPAIVGEYAYYTLDINNSGPSSAYNVIVNDVIPSTLLSSMEISTNRGSTWTEWAGNRSTLITLPGESSSLLIRGRVKNSASSSFDNTATINSDTTDPDMSNNESTTTTFVDTAPPTPPTTAADLSVIKTGGADEVPVGGTVTYTVIVSNAGPDTATSVNLSDIASGGLSNIQYSIDGGVTWSNWNGSYNLGDIISGGTQTVLIKGTVISAGYIANTATVTTTATDPDITNNTSVVVTPVSGFAQLTLQISPFCKKMNPCGEVYYAVTIENNGPSPANNVVLIDTLQECILNPQFSIDGGLTWSNWFETYNMGTVAPSSRVVILLRGTVDPACGCDYILSNTAQVTSTTFNYNVVNTIATSDVFVVKKY